MKKARKTKAPDALSTWIAVADAWRRVFFAPKDERKAALLKADRLWDKALEAFPEHLPKSHADYLEWKKGWKKEG